LRFTNLLAPLLVSLAVLAGCGEDTTRRSVTFSAQPAAAVAGQALSAVTVTILDGEGQPAVAAEGNVTVSLHAGPEGAQLQGTLSRPVSEGRATFNDLSVSKAGTGLVLKAAHGGKEFFSQPFNVGHAAANAVAIVAGPSEIEAGQPFAPNLQVRVNDAFGNQAAGASGEVVVTLVDAASTGARLLGAREARVTNGVAVFPNLSVDKAGDFTLSFTGASLTAATSAAFKVNPGKGTFLAITSGPAASSVAGAALGPVVVEARDARGNLDRKASGSVTVVLNGEATLGGTRTAAFTDGRATFSNLRIEKAGTGYTLTATSADRVPATSASFDVVAAAAASVEFTSAPTTGTAGVGFGAAVRVTDAFGNPASGNAVLTAAGPTGATLTGTTTVALADGVASFSGLVAERAGSYTLTVTVGAASGSAAAFTVAAAAAATLELTAAPTEATAGAAFTPAVAVRLADAFGNPAAGTVTLAVQAGPTGGVLTGATEVAAVNGVATFAGVNARKAGAYTLRASLGVLTADTASFTVAAADASVATFTAQPAAATAGVDFAPAVAVAVTDAFGNTANGQVTLTAASAPMGGQVLGTLTATSTGGAATFPGLRAQRAGTYRLRATVGTGAGTLGAPFTVSPAAPALLQVLAQPTGGVSNAVLAPTVVLIGDQYGNLATNYAGNVAIALGANPSAATLGGTRTAIASGGSASFDTLTVSAAGAGYTLVASIGTVTVETAPFDVTAGGARLVYTEPTTGTLRLVRNPASTDGLLVLDLVAFEDVTGFGVGFNLPVDAARVRLAANGFVPGTALNLGAAPHAAKATQATTGPLAGIITSAASQKAGGAGGVSTDAAVPAGSVLYSLRLELVPGASPGTAIDGAALGAAFNGAMRTRDGTDVVGRNGFGIGTLRVE
jgi:hypothetical protein